MRTTLAFLLLFLCVGTLAAQDNDFARRSLLSPTWAWINAASSHSSNRAFINGQSTIVFAQFYLASPEGQAELQLTDEQREKLAYLNKPYGDIVSDWFTERMAQEGSELTQIYKNMREMLPQDDIHLEKATPEEIEEYKEKYMQLAGTPAQLLHDSLQQQIESVLTPEQMNKLRIVELQVGGGNISTAAFLDPLDLSDEQRTELEEIQKERQAEIDLLLNESTEDFLEELYKLQEVIKEIDKTSPMKSNEEVSQTFQSAQDKLKNDPEWRKYRDEKQLPRMERLSSVSKKYREKYMDVLTDEQLDKFQQLIANKSDVVKKHLAQFANNDTKPSDNEWRPGLGSWKPGDGMPEEFKEERKTRRFPTKTAQ
ncbi:MAG: hypothetical protein ACRC2T_13530 [Thermoguttaceae bacterium]